MSNVGFQSWLIRRGYRDATIEYYLQKLKQIEKECSPLTLKTFDEYLVSKKRAGGKATSLNKLISTLRIYGDFAGLDWPMQLEWFREEEPNKEVFSDEEIEQIIALKCPPNRNLNVWNRWTMWLQVLAFSGMRASEVSTLTVNQVDWGSNNFILTITKTTPRRVPIAANLKEPLKEYMKDVDWYLFPVPGKRGHVWRNGWQKHVSLRIKIAGIKRAGLSTHSFRHSHASNQWEEGAPLPDIMKIHGWKNAATAVKYAHLGDKSTQKSINIHRIVRKHADPRIRLATLIEEARKAGMLDDVNFTWKLDPIRFHIEIVEKKVDS